MTLMETIARSTYPEDEESREPRWNEEADEDLKPGEAEDDDDLDGEAQR
jgi:hypothetical protein